MKITSIEPLVFNSNMGRVDFKNHEMYSLKLLLSNSVGIEAEIFAVIDMHRRLFQFRGKDRSYFVRIIDGFKL